MIPERLNIFSLLLIFLFIGVVVAETLSAVSCPDERSVFRTGEYLKGVARLNSIFEDPDTDRESRICALYVLAETYEEKAGDYDRAALFFKRVREMDSSSLPFKKNAITAIGRIERLKEKNSKTDKRLMLIKSSIGIIFEKNEIMELIKELREISFENYYRRHEVLYYEGLLWYRIQEYGRALDLFRRVLLERPAADFYLPVSGMKNEASKRHTGMIITNLAAVTAALLFLLAIALFFYSKPRRWIKIRHIIYLIMVLTCWYAVFTFSFNWLAENSGALETLTQDPKTVLPVVVHSGPGSPGAEIAHALFRYGFIAIIVLFLFTTGTGNLAKRFTALALNYIFAWLLFISVSALFYMHYCYDNSFYEAKQGNALNHLKGNLYFPAGDEAKNLIKPVESFERGLKNE